MSGGPHDGGSKREDVDVVAAAHDGGLHEGHLPLVGCPGEREPVSF